MNTPSISHRGVDGRGKVWYSGVVFGLSTFILLGYRGVKEVEAMMEGCGGGICMVLMPSMFCLLDIA